MILAQSDMAVSSFTRIVEQGGFVCALAVVLTSCFVLLWKMALAPLLDRVITMFDRITTISSQVRDVVSTTERTATILASAVANLRVDEEQK
jgi:hypothetical protein